MKKIIITILTVTMAIGLYARADTATPSSFYYVFHLFQNNTGQLVTDRDFKFSYDIIPGVFVQPAVGQFPYRGEVINLIGGITVNFKFDVKSGKLSINAPYVADAQKVIFYNNQNQPVLTISVSESSFCNDDGICNADRGEDYLSCSNDCKAATLPAPSTTPSISSTSGSSGLLSGILYTLGGLILAGLSWWYFKRRNNSSGMILPPPSLPTPPAPPSTNNPV